MGATNWFIRWPFVIEGVIVGFFGGLLAVLLLTIAKETFIDPLSDRFALLAGPDTIDFALLVVVLMFASIAVSAIGQRHHPAPLPARLGGHCDSRRVESASVAGSVSSLRRTNT